MSFDNTKVHGPGRKLLIAAMAAAFGLGLSGCGDDNTQSDATTGPGLGNQTGPVGTVIGNVIDTNGNPISGAMVTIGSRTVTTNAAGAYEFVNIAVVDSVPTTGGSAANVALPIFIQAPAGFLSGTVNVVINSQITCSDPAGGGGQTNPQCVLIDGFNVGAGATTLPATNTTVRGTLRDQVTGLALGNQILTLDFDVVNVDQNDPPGVTRGAFQASGAILTTTTDASGNFTFANVAADSCYELRAQNLDLNSLNNPTPCGADTGTPGGTTNDAATILFATVTESTQTTNLGEILATTISNSDLTSPFVTIVEGVIDGTANPGQLRNGVNTTFNITFSEALALPAGTTQSDVIVTRGGGVNPIFIASTVTVTGPNTISVVVPAAIPVGSTFSIDLRQDVFVDTSDNALVLNAQNAASPQGGGQGGPANTFPPVAYDSISPTAGYVRLNLQIFRPLDTNTDAATVAQDILPDNPTSDQFFAATNALADFDPGTGNRNFANNLNGNTPQNIALSSAGFQQLNAVFPLTAGQVHPLQALSDILQDRILNGNGPVVDVAAAEADIVFGTANHYLAWVETSTGSTIGGIQMSVGPVSSSAAGNPRIVGTLEGFQPGVTVPRTFSSAVAEFPGCANPTAGFGNDVCPIFVITPGNAAAGKIFIRHSDATIFKPLRPGAVLKVIARTASGFTGSEQTIPLIDAVRPTAGAQFFAGTAGALNSANVQNSGSGGTTINLTTATGQVVYPITPQALELVEDAAPGPTGLSGDTLREIMTAPLSGSPLDPGAASGNFIADAQGTAAFIAADARGLGLVVTEPSAIIAGAVPTLSAGVTSLFGTFTSINNGVDELNMAVNLIGFNSNVFTLETDGRANTRTVNFSPVFTDTAAVPNQASNAIVNLRDFLPPIMTKAFFDGRQFVFRFHEAVRGNGVVGDSDIVIECGATDVALDLDAPQAGAVLFGDSNRRVIIPLAVNGGANSAILTQPAGISSACFSALPALAYAEGPQYTLATLMAAGDTTLPTVSSAPPKGVLTYPSVRDLANNSDLGTANGNTWAFWASQNLGMGRDPTPAMVDSGDETTPLFAIANILPPFIPQTINRGTSYTSTAPNNVLALGGTVNVTIVTSTPFFLADGAMGNLAPDDFFGDDAEEAPYGNDDNVLTNVELLNWARAKFQYIDDNAGVAAPLPPADTLSGVQVLDAAGIDVLTTAGNKQAAQTIILTFTPGGIAVPAAFTISAADRIVIQPGTGLTSQFDPMNAAQSIYPFDEASALPPPTPANGVNDTIELQSIPPIPQTFTCPQAAPAGTTGEC